MHDRPTFSPEREEVGRIDSVFSWLLKGAGPLGGAIAGGAVITSNTSAEVGTTAAAVAAGSHVEQA